MSETSPFYATGGAPPNPVPPVAMREITLDPEQLGRLVRSTWVAWACTQPAPPADWLDLWEALPACIQAVDSAIGVAVYSLVTERIAELEAQLADSRHLNALACNKLTEWAIRAQNAEAALPSCQWCEAQTGARVPLLPGHTHVPRPPRVCQGCRTAHPRGTDCPPFNEGRRYDARTTHRV